MGPQRVGGLPQAAPPESAVPLPSKAASAPLALPCRPTPIPRHRATQILVNLPILAVDVIVMSVPLYFMVGFTPQAGPFFTFLLIMLSLNIAVDNLYRQAGSSQSLLAGGSALTWASSGVLTAC